MQTNHASQTALATAYLRAAHQILDTGTRVLDDPMAVPLLGPLSQERIRGASDHYMSPSAKALRAHVVLRSRYAEDRLALAMGRGLAQYIILGAGFDTFALRQPEWAKGLSIIEIDHPDTQKLKLAKIQDAGMCLPSNVHFVSVDFEQETIDEALRRAGVDRSRPVFFSWLGVTMYLTADAIHATLRSMAACAAGSEAVITFLQKPPMDSPQDQALAERVAQAGEPFVSYFSPEGIVQTLLDAGFSQTHLLSADQSAAYFSDGASSLPNPQRISVISAIV